MEDGFDRFPRFSSLTCASDAPAQCELHSSDFIQLFFKQFSFVLPDEGHRLWL